MRGQALDSEGMNDLWQALDELGGESQASLSLCFYT
jgi:hypothetical protein